MAEKYPKMNNKLTKGPVSTKFKKTVNTMKLLNAASSTGSNEKLRLSPEDTEVTVRKWNRRLTLSSTSIAISVICQMGKLRAQLHPDEEDKDEDTYALIKPSKKFDPRFIRPILQDVLDNEFDNIEYNYEMCRQITLDVTNVIKEKIKECVFPRYKIMCQLVIGQVNGQGLEIASRGLWDPDTDGYVSVSYVNETLFAVAFVYGVYNE